MATGFKTGGKNFKKGSPSANPKGRPKLTSEQKAIKKRLASYDGKLMIAKYALMTSDELHEIIFGTDGLTAIEMGLARLLKRVSESGSIHEIAWVLERIFDVQGPDDGVKVAAPKIEIITTTPAPPVK